MNKIIKIENLIYDCLFPIFCLNCGAFIKNENGLYLCETCLKTIPLYYHYSVLFASKELANSKNVPTPIIIPLSISLLQLLTMKILSFKNSFIFTNISLLKIFATHLATSSLTTGRKYGLTQKTIFRSNRHRYSSFASTL